MEDDIGGGFEDGAVFKKSQRFESEGGVGGKAAEHTDEEKDADIGSQEGSGFC